MTRFKPMIIGALGLGAAALVSTGASAQVRHGGWHGGGGGYHGAYYGGGGGWYGGHHGGWGNGFFPAALAVGALTGAIGAIAGGADYDYGYPGAYPAYAAYPAAYPAYPVAYPYPAYPYPAYGAYPVTYAPAPYYYGRRIYGPRRFVGAYRHRVHIGGHRGMMRVGYRGHR